MNERFMVDDCGTLIDMKTRNTYDYVSEVCDLLNKLHNDKEKLLIDCNNLIDDNTELVHEINQEYFKSKELKKELQNIYDIATLNKAVSIIEKKYDNYLNDKDVDCIPCKRKAYVECIELLDDFRDDIL